MMISSFQSYSDFESDYDLTFVPPKWKPNISEAKTKSGTTGNGNGTSDKNDSKQQQNQRPEQQQHQEVGQQEHKTTFQSNVVKIDENNVDVKKRHSSTDAKTTTSDYSSWSRDKSHFESSTESFVERSTSFVSMSNFSTLNLMSTASDATAASPPPRPPPPDEKNFDEDFGSASRFSTFERSGDGFIGLGHAFRPNKQFLGSGFESLGSIFNHVILFRHNLDFFKRPFK